MDDVYAGGDQTDALQEIDEVYQISGLFAD